MCGHNLISPLFILQVLYATEGESVKPVGHNQQDSQDKSGVIDYKGHDFIPISFRTPTTCEACHKPCWHMLHPPLAIECRRKSFGEMHRVTVYCIQNVHVCAYELNVLEKEVYCQ